MIFGVTGHRPPRLNLKYDAKSLSVLDDFVFSTLNATRPSKLLTGMAQGWDIACARIAVKLKIPFDAYIPFESQDSKWPAHVQREYRYLLSKADNVLDFDNGDKSRNKLYLLRDRAIADNCNTLFALFDGKYYGGTSYTVKYAEGHNIPVWNVFQLWEEFKEKRFKTLKKG